MKRFGSFILIFLLAILSLCFIQLQFYKYIVNKTKKEYEIHFLRFEEKYSYCNTVNDDFSQKTPIFILNKSDCDNFRNKYGIDLPIIDFENKESFIVSFEKPILVVYYQIKKSSDWSYDMPHAEALFDENYIKDTIFVYKIKNEKGIWAFGLP
ncbi:MAG: hypothetical protein ACI4MA_01415 [Treponema sp.]